MHPPPPSGREDRKSPKARRVSEVASKPVRTTVQRVVGTLDGGLATEELEQHAGALRSSHSIVNSNVIAERSTCHSHAVARLQAATLGQAHEAAMIGLPMDFGQDHFWDFAGRVAVAQEANDPGARQNVIPGELDADEQIRWKQRSDAGFLLRDRQVGFEPALFEVHCRGALALGVDLGDRPEAHFFTKLRSREKLRVVRVCARAYPRIYSARRSMG